MYPMWITEPRASSRSQQISRCLFSPGPAQKRLSTLGRSLGLDSNVPVLVRGEQDGFYYRGTVKEEIESERGMFLVEFAKPIVSCRRHPVCVQKTPKDDILEYVNGMKHSLLPGDKVLAPWEPDMARYGPGTVLTGIETRDPLRASEDEEIMVEFWNDKKVKLPQGVALWIPPSLWERIVEMIHMPFTNRSLVFQSDTKESSSEPSPCLLEWKGPKQEVTAAVAAPSSSSCDLECNLEPFPTKSTVVDSAVNTGSGCPEEPRLEDSARPKWKYCERSDCKSHPSNSGLSSCSSTCTKGKQESKAISLGHMSHVAPTNGSAMFETVEQSPRQQLTMKETLRDQDFKLSLGAAMPL
ncbi:uncharacterized protein C11orf16 homolog [Colius striatus]|uniref:uncharacterized protein C11orf16 homolog n=1 Tax=Colius striatus TaxID=57412 RepID=UPI002B1E18AD|nr:uncharacterized protein C11orf16 homolog [Colius striatus]